MKSRAPFGARLLAALPPKEAARTCKKLPVASFCASETAETGRIANGREQGDHVSRRQSGKGFNFVRAKFWFCALIRGLQNFETPCKGNDFILFACTKRTKSTPEVCEPLDSGDDSNLRSIQDFGENDRRSLCNRPRRELQAFRVSPVRI